MIEWVTIGVHLFAELGLHKIISLSKRDFAKRLESIYNQTVDEFKNLYKLPNDKEQYAFYNYQDILEQLLKFSFFQDFDYNAINEAIEKNSNAIKPEPEDLLKYLQLFFSNCKKDKDLEKIELNEKGIKIVIGKVDEVKKIVDEIRNDVKKIIPSENKLPHSLTSIPHNMTENVFGRDDDLFELHKLLNSNSTVLVVNGVGGIGKSTLAQKYVQIHKNEFDHIAFIEVASEFDSANSLDDTTAFLSAFADNKNNLVTNLRLNIEEKTPLEERFRLISNALQSITGKNLLVIDNTSNILINYVNELPAPPGWKVLATSRQKMGAHFTEKDLDKLTPEPARDLFYKYYKLQKDNSLLDSILESFERHTLTIELLAKTGNERNIKLPELKEIIEKDGLDFKKATPVVVPHGKVNSDGEYLFEHLLKSFVIKLSEECKALLLYFSILPSIPVPYADLLELFGIEKVNDNSFFENLNRLVKLGWLIKDNDTYRCHQVIQQTTRKQLLPNDENCKILAQRLRQLIKFDDNTDNPIDKFKWMEYAYSVIRHLSINSRFTANIANDLGILLRIKGYYTEAKMIMKYLLLSSHKIFKADDFSNAIFFSNLALVLQELGELQEAKGLMRKTVQIAINKYNPDHPNVATSISNLATILKYLGELSEAKDLMKQALQSNIKNFGEDHPSTARNRSNLAMVLLDLGELSEAKEQMKKAFQSTIKNFGDDHPSTALIRSNLATILSILGEYSESKELIKKALQSTITTYGENHPFTAICRSNLAAILQALGELTEAKELIIKAYDFYRNKFGYEHYDTKLLKRTLEIIEKEIAKKK